MGASGLGREGHLSRGGGADAPGDDGAGRFDGDAPAGSTDRLDPELRARGWRLLSSLYLEGPGPEALPTLRSVPGLADALPDPFDADEAAAAHHRLFELEVFPYASVFLERDGVLGGPVSESVRRAFDRAGLGPAGGGDGSGPPDHLGRELALLAALTTRGDREGLAAMLEGHLLWWLPVLVHSVERVAPPFWRAVARLTLEAALDQLHGIPARPATPRPPGALALPPEDPLADDDAGLRRLARHAVTPARGGLYLSITDLRRLGRGRDLPGGFGRREQVMTNLLRSAAGYGALGGLVDDLRALVEGQRAFLDGVPEPFRAPWSDRMDGLVSALERLRAGGG